VNLESSVAGDCTASAITPVIPADDPEALEQLFASWMPRLYRAASRMLHNPEDSEDAMQDTLLSAFQNLNQFEGRAKFTTWMYSILLNTVRARLRKRRSQPDMCSIDAEPSEEETRSFAVELVDLGPNPEQECAREEKGRILAESFQKLPEAYQSVIWLCDVEELGQKEAAERLGLPLGTVKCQLHRARRLFSKRARRARAFPAHCYPESSARRTRVSGSSASAVSS
jgi:RNA polymerase sigma-70 factor (ECF subfamily)